MVIKSIKSAVSKLAEYAFPQFWFKKTYYSQTGEDAILFPFISKIKKGFYVDIGAHHPYRFSNTAALYKKGWNGINVEPNVSLYKAFKRLRKRDINLNIGITKVEGNMTFYIFNEGALSTFSKDTVSYHEKIINNQYFVKEKKQIPTSPLNKIFDKYIPDNRTIDLLTIDVEGLDFEVLQTNDWNLYTPKFILIECFNDLEDFLSDPVYLFLKSKNYILVGKTYSTSLFKYNGNSAQQNSK